MGGGGVTSQEYLQCGVFVGGGGVVFVKQNNIFYMPSINTGVVHQVTTTGVAATVYNGVADWLYEGGSQYSGVIITYSVTLSEEILGQSEALWVSPDGTRLAYIMFNDSMVELVTLREYGTNDDSIGLKESKLREKAFRYPKVSHAHFFVEFISKDYLI